MSGHLLISSYVALPRNNTVFLRYVLSEDQEFLITQTIKKSIILLIYIFTFLFFPFVGFGILLFDILLKQMLNRYSNRSSTIQEDRVTAAFTTPTLQIVEEENDEEIGEVHLTQPLSPHDSSPSIIELPMRGLDSSDSSDSQRTLMPFSQSSFSSTSPESRHFFRDPEFSVSMAHLATTSSFNGTIHLGQTHLSASNSRENACIPHSSSGEFQPREAPPQPPPTPRFSIHHLQREMYLTPDPLPTSRSWPNEEESSGNKVAADHITDRSDKWGHLIPDSC